VRLPACDRGVLRLRPARGAGRESGGGRFTTLPLTRHATTNLEVIARFVELDTKIEANTPGGVEVTFG